MTTDSHGAVAGGRRVFRPRLWPTVIAVALVALLIALGGWQLQRLAWKEALIAEIEARYRAAPIALPDPLGDPEALSERRVRVTGRLLHAREMLFAARSFRGQSGFHVVTPLVLGDGRTLFLDRGWVPPQAKDPAARPESLPEGEVTLEAVVHPGGWRGVSWLRPDNLPEEGLWLWPDLPAMARAAGLPEAVTALYLVARTKTGKGRWPVAQAGGPRLANNHLGYALTWFALAAVLALIYVISQFRSGAPRQ